MCVSCKISAKYEGKQKNDLYVFVSLGFSLRLNFTALTPGKVAMLHVKVENHGCCLDV